MRNQINLEQILRTASEPTDERAAVLWDLYRKGDRNALGALWIWIGNRVYPVLRGLLRCDQLAEEGVQTVLTHLLTKPEKMPEFAAARWWLRRVSRNIANQLRRADSRREARDAKAAKPDATTDASLERVLTEAAVREALARLSDSDHELIVLFHFERYSIKDAAGEVKCDSKTFAKRLAAAEGRLRELLALLGVTVAVANAATAALPAGPSSLSPDRLAEMLARAWEAAGPATAHWTKAALVAGAILFTGGLAVGGWALLRTAEPAPVPVPSTPSAPETPETFHAKYQRLAERDVLPQLAEVLRPWALGSGEVVAEVVELYDTRLDVTFALTQRVGWKPDWKIRVRFIHDLHTRRSAVFLDDDGTGKFRSVDQKGPIKPWAGGPGLPFQPLNRALAVLTALPADERSAVVAEDYRSRMREAFKPYLGTWYRQSNPALACSAGWTDAGPWIKDDREYLHSGYAGFRLLPDGRPCALLYHGSDLVFSHDRARFITLPKEWWSRQPDAR